MLVQRIWQILEVWGPSHLCLLNRVTVRDPQLLPETPQHESHIVDFKAEPVLLRVGCCHQQAWTCAYTSAACAAGLYAGCVKLLRPDSLPELMETLAVLCAWGCEG